MYHWVPSTVVPTLKSGIFDRRCQEKTTIQYSHARICQTLWAWQKNISYIQFTAKVMSCCNTYQANNESQTSDGGAKQFAQCLWSWLPHWLCISHNYSQCSYNTQLWRLSLPRNQSRPQKNPKQMSTTFAYKPWFMCLIGILWFKNFATEGTNATLI